MSDKATEFITLMTAVKELINEAGQQANMAAGIADEGEQLFAQGGNATSQSEMALAAESARKAFTQATGLLSIADEAINHAQAAAGNLPAAGGGARSPTPEPRPAPLRQPFKPMRSDRDKIDEIKPHVGKNYAVATLWDSDGNKVLGPHQADDDGPAATASWRPPWSGYPRLRRHVEAHAAARMKPGDTMAMYINLPACSYPDGCEKNLRDIIPEGATLWVHWVKPSGTVKATPYRGTGRAIDDRS